MRRRHRKLLVAVMALLTLSGCVTAGLTGGPPATSLTTATTAAPPIDLAALERQEAGRAWSACQADALTVARSAETQPAPAQFLASARMLEACEAAVPGSMATEVSPGERAQAAALAIVNLLKGGDAAGAGRALARFRGRFPGIDLQLAGGGSFLETMALLTGPDRARRGPALRRHALDQSMARELRRIWYWRHDKTSVAGRVSQ